MLLRSEPTKTGGQGCSFAASCRPAQCFCFVFQWPALGGADMPFAIIPTKPYTITPADLKASEFATTGLADLVPCSFIFFYMPSG